MAHLATTHSVRCYTRTLSLTSFVLLTLLYAGQTAMAQTTYYVSTAGNDASNGTSPSTPWKTIGKVNTLSGNLASNTTIRFMAGQTFRGSIELHNGNGLTLGTYGTGAPAIIKGSIAVPDNWIADGGGLYHTTLDAPAGNYVSHVYQGGQLLQLARYPNVDIITPENSWLYNDDGHAFILDNELAPTINRPLGYWNDAWG